MAPRTPQDCSTTPLPQRGIKPRRFSTSLDSEENRLLLYAAFLDGRYKSSMARQILTDYLRQNAEDIEAQMVAEAQQRECTIEQLQWFALGEAKRSSRTARGD